MEYFLERIIENIFVIAVWDNTWNSYNNCYLIIDDKGVVLIDSGKSYHKEYIIKALRQIRKTEKDITTIIFTHGHWDHIDGSQTFNEAEKLIHRSDMIFLNIDQQGKIKAISTSDGSIEGLDYLLVGHHTPGSTVLYSPTHKVLFAGDFHCFFGETINSQSIVGEWYEIRDKSINLVKEIVAMEGSFHEYKLDEYFRGLEHISSLKIDYLCTGHGIVLKNEINRFIEDLLSCETK